MPGGGDCEGTTAAITASVAVELSTEGRKSSATSMEVKPANTGETVAGGICGWAVQQAAFRDSQGMLICMQQLWVACCAGTTQVPIDNNHTTMKVMVTAVRWANRCNMVPDYHALTI